MLMAKRFSQSDLEGYLDYEVVAEPTSPYKELASTLPAAQVGPVSIEVCEAALRKIAQSYRVDCKFD